MFLKIFFIMLILIIILLIFASAIVPNNELTLLFMEEFKNLNLPSFKVSILYRNGDVREFISNNFDRADKLYRRFFNLNSFCELHDLIKSVRFFNGSTGLTRFLNFD